MMERRAREVMEFKIKELEAILGKKNEVIEE